jgi:hypothetical protein
MARLFGRTVLLTALPFLTLAFQSRTASDFPAGEERRMRQINAGPNPDNYLDDPQENIDPAALMNSSFAGDADVLVFSFDRKERAHMLKTVFGHQYLFKYSVVNPEGLPMNVRFVRAAFAFVAERKPRLVLWMFPMAEAVDSLRQAVLPMLHENFAAARRSSPGTRHGVFHWTPEYCHTFPPAEVQGAYESVDFVFQFGYQDERLASSDPKYMPWPLGPAEWRSWRAPTRKNLKPLSQRDHFAVYRGSNNTHKPFDVSAVRRYPGVVAETRGGWNFSDGQADVDRYLELLTTGQYALSPAGHNPNCFRIQEAVESGAIPVIVVSTDNNPHHCYSNWAALYGLPAATGTKYPWIPKAPFYVLPSWSAFGDHVEAMRAGATDQAGKNLQRWYNQWLAAFHDRLELLVRR